MKIKVIKYPQQHGVILIIALMLIVVIAVSAVAAYKLSGVDNLINNNTRARAQALQAAELAISYCKDEVFKSNSSIKPLPSKDDTDEGVEWKDLGNWDASKDSVAVLTNTQMGGLATFNRKPMCLVENISKFVEVNSQLEDGLERKIVAYRITARGFSPDFVMNDGYQTAGAQAWMQVVVGRMLK